MKHTALTIAVLGVMSASAVQAQTTAQATTALNLRAGPGPSAEILSVIPAEGEVSVDACLDADKWCQVTYDGTSGWAYGDYLTVTPEGASEPVVLYDNREQVTVRTVTREDAGGAALSGGTIGAIAGSLIGGPVGAAIGGVAGATFAAGNAPDEQVTTYVRSNPVEQVYLDGEVVVGAGLPEAVELRTVPESEYVYAYVNGVPVLADPDSRQIVYILR